MKIKDFKYRAFLPLSDESWVMILSNKSNGVAVRGKKSTELITEDEWPSLATAENMVKKSTAESGFPHVIFTFPDTPRSRRCYFVLPLTRHVEDMEFPDPHSMPPFEELCDEPAAD